MPYQQTTTLYVVRLVPLRGLSATTLARCQQLRAEAGRLWTDLMRQHAAARTQGQWFSAGDLEQATKGGQYALHSQSVQALCQKFAANVATAPELRRQEFAATGQIQTAYPHHPKPDQTVVWKDQALRVLPDGSLRLPCGGQRPPLLLPLPQEYRSANLRRVELTWRADHYELALTVDTGTSWPVPLAGGAVAGVDLGEVHIAAITTTTRHALVLCGRRLRACKQGRNRVHSILQEKLSRCQQGSKRWRRLTTCKARVSAKVYRQQREILHQAARQAVAFCQAEGVTRIVVGDVRDIQTGVSLGRVSNQKISQWPHGQFVHHMTEKAQQGGISVEWIDESLSTRTCSHCGHVRSSSPRGRRFRCPGCGARVHRDVNGANNICSQAMHGEYAKVQASALRYRRPIVVVPRRRPKRRRTRSRIDALSKYLRPIVVAPRHRPR
jgi:putative transposase